MSRSTRSTDTDTDTDTKPDTKPAPKASSKAPPVGSHGTYTAQGGAKYPAIVLGAPRTDPTFRAHGTMRIESQAWDGTLPVSILEGGKWRETVAVVGAEGRKIEGGYVGAFELVS